MMLLLCHVIRRVQCMHEGPLSVLFIHAVAVYIMLLVLCLGSHHRPGSNDREQQHSPGAGLGSHQQHHCTGHWPGVALTDRLLQPDSAAHSLAYRD